MTLLAAGLAGMAVLTLEILGVHMLAPWFGTSALVWSQQIGIVLLAIALGGWAGGRAAKRGARPRRAAGVLLIAGALLTAAAVVLLPVFSRWLLPEGMTLEEAAEVFTLGSFSAATLFFAPPVFLLSMVAPLLVQARASDTRPAGQAAGQVSAVGTFGSLVGVFGSTFVAIPFVGVQATLVGTAAVLAVAGAMLLGRPAAAAVALLPAAALAAPDHAGAAHLPEGAEVLEVAESPYQHLRVIEFADGERWLQMNEGLDSYQSRQVPGSDWPGGYYDVLALAPAYALHGREVEEARLWFLGFGAGSVLPPCAAILGRQPWRAVGVELDPEVVRLGRRWMPLPEEVEERTRVVSGADARSFLRAAEPGVDAIVVDAYARQFEIPPHLVTREFFAEAHDRLADGGVLALNVGLGGEAQAARAFLDRLRATLEPSFGEHVRAHRVPRSRNWVVFARRGRPLPPAQALGTALPAGTPLEVGAALLPGQTLAGTPRRALSPFTDDRNPVTVAQALQWWGR